MAETNLISEFKTVSEDSLPGLNAPSHLSQERIGILLRIAESATCQQNDRELQHFLEQRLLSFKKTKKKKKRYSKRLTP